MQKRRAKRAFSSVLLVLLAPCLFAQTPPATSSTGGDVTTLHVTSRVVEISAVVRERDNTPVAGLGKEDFILKQDGKEVPIRYFSEAVDLPLSFALMVDVSGSQRTFIGDESLASEIFFRTVLGRPSDRAMLLEFDAGLTQIRDFTDDANQLRMALSSLGLRPERQGATLLYDSVEAVARQKLQQQKGRKAIVLLTDGGDRGSRKTIDQAIEQAQRGNIQIYAVYYSAFQGMTIPAGTPGIHASAAEADYDALKKLASATGGRVFTVAPRLGLQAIYTQIAQDLRTQYEIGYTPPPDLAPNSFHRLELKTKEKRETVQARSGFYAQP
jgi:VWFA-related protein